jgi:hypothetical protein
MMDDIYDNIELKDGVIFISSHIYNKYNDNAIIFTAYTKFQNDMVMAKKYELKEKRLNQTEFRKYLIERDKRCIITSSNSDICEACHIIPYSECGDDIKFDINNGILLEAGLHKLFDMYLWSINPNTKILEVNAKIINNNSYNLINVYNGKYINFDKNIVDNLRIHYELFLNNRICIL